MPNFILSRNERLYVAVESAFGTAATVSGSNAVRIKPGGDMSPVNDVIVPASKNGTRSQPNFLPGRMNGTFAYTVELIPSGTAGTAPECDKLLQGIFGQAPTVASSTSVTYTLADAIPSLSCYSYRTDNSGGVTGVSQRLALSTVLREMALSFGGNIPEIAFSGDCKFVTDSQSWSAYTGTYAEAKGGLSSFAVEPASPVYVGTQIPGFVGSATLDSNSFQAELISGTLRVQTGNEVVKNTFSKYFPQSAEGDLRNVTLDLNIYDTNGSTVTNLKTKAMNQTPIAITLVIGVVAGYTVTITLPRVLLNNPKYNDGQRRYDLSFSGCRCLASTNTSLDEVSIAWT